MGSFAKVVFLSALFAGSSVWSSTQEERLENKGKVLTAPRSYQDSLELYNQFAQGMSPKKDLAHELSHIQQQNRYGLSHIQQQNKYGFVPSTKTQLVQAEQDYNAQENYVRNLKRYGVSENSAEMVQAKRGANLRWQILESYKGNIVSKGNYPYQDVIDNTDYMDSNDRLNYRRE